MNVNLMRFYQDDAATLGILTIEGVKDPVFYTIERPWLDNEREKSCIPEGTYECTYRESHNNGEVYQLKDVPNRDYIQIHVANTTSQVKGCIGLGLSVGYVGKDKKAVHNSVLAMNQLLSLMNKEPFNLTIRG